jgi:membrane protein DedA with SNARE-associated domain
MLANIIDQIATFIQQVVQSLGYPGLGAVMFLENIFPPIPSELIMPFSGFLVGRGEFSFVGVWVASTVGSVLGALALYGLGRWLGEAVIRSILRRWGNLLTVHESDYDRALRYFQRYGDAIIFFGRLIPLVRSIVSIPAGANKMPLPKFIAWTTLGSALWNGVLAFAGMELGANWEQVIHFIEQYQNVVVGGLVVAGLAFGFFMARRIWRRHFAVSSAAG